MDSQTSLAFKHPLHTHAYRHKKYIANVHSAHCVITMLTLIHIKLHYFIIFFMNQWTYSLLYSNNMYAVQCIHVYVCDPAGRPALYNNMKIYFIMIYPSIVKPIYSLCTCSVTYVHSSHLAQKSTLQYSSLYNLLPYYLKVLQDVNFANH